MSLNIFTELEITQDLKISNDLEILQNIDICGNILMTGVDSILELKTIKSNRSTTSDPCGNYVDISGSALLVPRGSTASRMSTDGSATAKAGMIMYDTDQNQFVGVIDTEPYLVWTGLGGVISTDQKTRIEATNDGTNNSGLKFFTNTLGENYNMCINENGNVGIGNAMFSANEFLSNASHLNLFTNTNASFLISHADIGQLDDQDFGGGLKLTFETGGNAKIYNTYSAGDLIFGSGGYNDRMRILANGNVGIGTDSPDAPLHVKSTTQFQGIFLDDENGLIVRIARGDSTGDPYIKLYSSISDNGVDIQSNGSSYFNGGNVGIGTDSPTSKLHIKGDGGNSAAIKIESTNSSGPGYMYIQRNIDGKCYVMNQDDNALILGASDNTSQLYLRENGNVGIGTTSPDAKLQVNGDFHIEGTNNAWTNDAGKGLYFRSGSNSSNDSYIQSMDRTNNAYYGLQFDALDYNFRCNGDTKMFINSDGNVGIGSTPSSSYKLYVSGNFFASTSISTNGDITAFAASDKRLKNNITPIQNPLEKLKKINGYTFDWIEKKDIHSNKGNDIGVIAQEIEEVLPEITTTRDNGYKAVRYEKLTPFLISCIKDQQTQIESLQYQIDELKELIKK